MKSEDELGDDVVTVPKYKVVARRECQLLNLTWERNWLSVVHRCETYPEEASCVTENWGRTALHLAMFNQGCPCYVGEALLKANPHAILVLDKSGYTPLHYACFFRHGTTDLIPILCTAAVQMERATGALFYKKPGTDVAKYQEKAQSPLFLACKRYAPLETMRTLVSAVDRQSKVGHWIAPITGGEPYWFDYVHPSVRSPLVALWDQKYLVPLLNSDTRMRMKEIVLEVVNGTIVDAGDVPSTSPDKDFFEFWRKSVLLLVASHDRANHSNGENDGSGNSFVMLHAVATLRLPIPQLVQVVASVFPEDAAQRDVNGFLPLHHIIRLIQEFDPVTIKSMFSALLAAYPAGASTTAANGELPLVTALKLGMSWDEGVEDLVMSAPEVLQVRGKITHLYPFLLAASRDASTDTIFRLLTCAPELVGQYGF